MTGEVFEPETRAYLAGLAANLRSSLPDLWSMATGSADQLRKQLPDIDDLTLGRALLALSAHFTEPGTGREEVTIANLWAGLASAGLQLTQQEWDEVQI